MIQCDCIASGNQNKPKQHGADPHAKNCSIYTSTADLTLHVPCQTCGAKIGDYCMKRDDGQTPRDPHYGRLEAAIRFDETLLALRQNDRQLFIDLDGVLADFDRFYADQFGVTLDRDAKDPPDLWDNIERYGRFYADLPLIPDALELWHGVRRLHQHPIILTGIPRSIHAVEQHKREWVARCIDKNATVICCASKDKFLHGKPGDVLIDDWHRYRPLWEKMGGIFILHTSARNSIALASGLFRGTP